MVREVTLEVLSSESFSPFGDFLRFSPRPTVRATEGYAWISSITPALSDMDGPPSLGWSVAASLPAPSIKMERHQHTSEALFCAADPVCLFVADTGGDRPSADDVRAFILEPGSVVVLRRGVWHDACRGLNRPTPYYWIANADPQITDPWVDIEGGPLRARA